MGDDFRRIIGLACFAVTMFAVASGSARAQPQFEEDFDDIEKPWQEIAIQLPAAPAAENLIPFETISATATQSFAIDAKSLTAGTDGVVRYTLISTSQAGAKNISYEGIRCDSMENKLYAFGHPNGTWSRSRRDKWEKIPRHSTNNHHATLALEYFCDGRTVAGNANEIVNRLKMRQPIYRGS
ncbi:CNP1-like family protein [Oxalobacteraceae bacterium R-40]|uniref:CNP1-like family protein n=1 Tax=Keguizhuia sedimenti TaxID=3064264 RepID=A0ABU1BQL3_9BURK|nr:CNP1-like family protein [Oxalobacteraceae bacterium R-40]